jgi:hypothetical protein
MPVGKEFITRDSSQKGKTMGALKYVKILIPKP